ncbi:glycosyltransferase family 1 protein [Dactylosporangium vinaceum]|uniref:Glycosyltransferase n=1 Tax=Dactylosporangium vinaceum TaxID=53362 RepID=A0ABV5MLU8_9ACTN|nr:glycosyltransferase [Dactylosporangium vinaceum]UAB94000.1 glycosyltransferase family 1 protein [Dactylosporangium vinaceum]
MSRFLLVVLPLAGHINAPLAVAAALQRAGHDVAWCGPESYLRPLVGPDAQIHPTGSRYYPEQDGHGPEALRFVWESYLVPMARFTLPAVERAVAAYRPDVLLADQHAFAGALVALRHGLPWATLAPSALELTRGPGADDLARPHLDRLREKAGLPPGTVAEVLFSPHLVLAFTTAALLGPTPLPDSCVLVGPAFGRGPAYDGFDWEWFDPGRRHVLITVGTLAEGVDREFFGTAVRALADLGDRLQAVLIAPAGAVPDPPAHILVAGRVPTLRMMPHLQAVVSHGGMGIVGEALANGVPLVVAPIRYDQPAVADLVAAAGAGIRVPFIGLSADELRRAVTTVLDDPAYRAGARTIGDSFPAAGGAEAAVAHLETLARKER